MSTDDANNSGPTESLVTVDRTMAIIEMLSDTDTGLSVSDISRRLDTNKSIALRILSSLELTNYIYRNQENKRYFLSYKVSNIGLRVLSRNRLLDQCQPKLRRLAEESGELVLFSIIDQGMPRWVLAAVGARRRLQIDPLTTLEPHSTATGKAWLSTLSDDAIAATVGQTFRALTPHTVTKLGELMEQVRVIRETGISFSNQENEAGIAAVATPIWQSNGDDRTCVGFVSITAPVSRATPEDFARFRQLLIEAARELADSWPAAAAADLTRVKLQPAASPVVVI